METGDIMKAVLYKKELFITLLIIVIVTLGFYFYTNTNMNSQEKNNGTFSIKSAAFKHNELIPSEYTCDGSDFNPPFEIENTPKETRSLVLIMDDPDAPAGVWDHWIKWNIPTTVKVIEEGVEPEGISGTGTSGNSDYHGPCPPSGTHRYIFKVYALDTLLNLSPGASKKEVEKTMEGHILQEARLIGLYKRE
jgi:Raf kinase inhibitor-like YbhB/YbcL family protein